MEMILPDDKKLAILRKTVLKMIDASGLSDKEKNDYHAMVWYLPKDRILKMIGMLTIEGSLRDQLSLSTK